MAATDFQKVYAPVVNDIDMVTQGTSGTSASVSVAVLEAVSRATGVDIIDIETPLATVVDPDCLEALWRPVNGADRDVNGSVSFDYFDCRVTVESDGTVEAHHR